MQLHNAVHRHDAARVETLIDEGADVSEEYDGKWHPIDLLWVRGDGEDHVDAAIACLKLLREAGATIGFRTLRQLTSEKAPLKLVRAVFDALDAYREIPNYTKDTEYTDTLYGAILGKNDIEVIRFLLDRGADPNHIHDVNPDIAPPADICMVPRQCLHVAIALGNEDAVRLLLEYGADPYAICKKNGTTSLHWYVTFGKKMTLIGDVWEARKSFDANKDRLHKELIEYVFHPARLRRLGFFSLQT